MWFCSLVKLIRLFRVEQFLHFFFGSSAIWVEGSFDLQEEVLIIPESVSPSFYDFDFIVDPFDDTCVNCPATVGENPGKRFLQVLCKPNQRFGFWSKQPFDTMSSNGTLLPRYPDISRVL